MLFEEDVTQGSESKKSYVLVEVALDQVERQIGDF